MLSGSSPAANLNLKDLLERFSSGSARQQRSLIKSVESRSADLAALGADALAGFDPEGDNWAAGWILQVLQRHNPEALPPLICRSEQGWFCAPSGAEI
ncbi:MAG: GUN4 domain-containing protein, partial [Prochlorococcus sp.]